MIAIASGTVLQADMRLSLATDTAFVDFGVENSLTPYIGCKIEIIDNAGSKKLVGYIKAAGTGVTLGGEQLTNSGFETGSPPSSWEVKSNTTFAESADVPTGGGSQSGDVLSTDGSSRGIYQDASTANHNGELLKLSGQYKKTVGSYGLLAAICTAAESRYNNTPNLSQTSWTEFTLYATPDAVSTRIFLYASDWDTGDRGLFDLITLKQVTSPGSTGVTISQYSTLTDQNWLDEESGFTRNDTQYTYTIYGSSGSIGTTVGGGIPTIPTMGGRR